MTTSKPKRTVKSSRTYSTGQRRGGRATYRWTLWLECGHTVSRAARRGQPRPKWVRCEECQRLSQEIEE